MLNYNKESDILEMKKYHRTKDMINLLYYFKDLSPIENLTIVKSLEDYKNNIDFCKSLPCERNDTLTTKPSMQSVEASETGYNIEDIFKKVKELDKDGVLVLFSLSHKPSERYERYAGISVSVSLGKCIYIDAVGKGFDGREVSKGIDCHERYKINWYDISTCNINNFKKFRTYLINEENYKKSREDRVNFLLSVGYKEDVINDNIPYIYEEIPDFIWLDVINNLIKKVDKMEEELELSNLTEFAISGHTEGKRFLPWQMFDKTRYTK